MKTVGLIGGMSWESSIEYYRIINQEIGRRLGPPHSAKIIMDSFDFAEIESLQHEGNWDEATDRMVQSAVRLETAGADFIVICTNTMHKMAGVMAEKIRIPILHIIDPTAKSALGSGMKKLGLLGTRFTMEEDFIKGRLIDLFHLEVTIPNTEERELIHHIIYHELVNGINNPVSKDIYKRIIQSLVHQGSEGIILGCTEIGLLVKEEDSPVPVFDTTLLHALAAAEEALKE